MSFDYYKCARKEIELDDSKSCLMETNQKLASLRRGEHFLHQKPITEDLETLQRRLFSTSNRVEALQKEIQQLKQGQISIDETTLKTIKHQIKKEDQEKEFAKHDKDVNAAGAAFLAWLFSLMFFSILEIPGLGAIIFPFIIGFIVFFAASS